MLNGLIVFIHNYIKFRWCRKKPFHNWWMWKLQNNNECDTVFYESKCMISAMRTWVAGFLVTPPQGDQVTWSVLKSSALLGLRNGTGSARMWVRSGWVWGACLTWPSTGTTYRGSTNISRRYAVKRHNHDHGIVETHGWLCFVPLSFTSEQRNGVPDLI